MPPGEPSTALTRWCRSRRDICAAIGRIVRRSRSRSRLPAVACALAWWPPSRRVR
jgi:hypothetical protein